MGSQRVRHDWVTSLHFFLLFIFDCVDRNKLWKILKEMGKRPACLSPEKPFSRSVSQFSPSVMSDSLPPHGLQHTRLPCPSPTLGAYSNSCPLSWWCHPTISSSVFPFFCHVQSFPESGSFQISQFFTSGDQSTEFQIQHQAFQWIVRTDFL